MLFVSGLGASASGKMAFLSKENFPGFFPLDIFRSPFICPLPAFPRPLAFPPLLG
jgi:hypothetical protein